MLSIIPTSVLWEPTDEQCTKTILKAWLFIKCDKNILKVPIVGHKPCYLSNMTKTFWNLGYLSNMTKNRKPCYQTPQKHFESANSWTLTWGRIDTSHILSWGIGFWVNCHNNNILCWMRNYCLIMLNEELLPNFSVYRGRYLAHLILRYGRTPVKNY